MKTKWYLGGPMTGLPNYNYDEFERVAKILRGNGFDIVSAHEIDHGETPETLGTTKPYGKYLIKAINTLSTCDGAIFLPNWTKSRGAEAEFNVCRACDMPVMFWVNEELSNVSGN